MHIRNDPSFFLTNKTGAPQGEELGLIKPLSESSLVDPTILSSRTELIDKAPVLQVQHQVPNQFEIPLLSWVNTRQVLGKYFREISNNSVSSDLISRHRVSDLCYHVSEPEIDMLGAQLLYTPVTVYDIMSMLSACLARSLKAIAGCEDNIGTIL
ncbi:hypothetical protein Tco_1176270 [Tanacetum coccineum]